MDPTIISLDEAVKLITTKVEEYRTDKEREILKIESDHNKRTSKYEEILRYVANEDCSMGKSDLLQECKQAATIAISIINWNRRKMIDKVKEEYDQKISSIRRLMRLIEPNEENNNYFRCPTCRVRFYDVDGRPDLPGVLGHISAHPKASFKTKICTNGACTKEYCLFLHGSDFGRRDEYLQILNDLFSRGKIHEKFFHYIHDWILTW
jgi:hypothetical protein